jgi:hypothetical protein
MLGVIYSVLKDFTVKESNLMALVDANRLVKPDVASPFNKLPECYDNEVIARIDNWNTLNLDN